MKKLLTAISLTCILFSCTKSSTDEYYTLSGVVLDYDSRTIIAGAKVYLGPGLLCIGNTCSATDSAISDAAGKVSFKVKSDGSLKGLTARKDNYIPPYIFHAVPTTNFDRTDTIYLSKPSFANITIHKTGAYLPLDSVTIKVSGDMNSYGFYRDLAKEKADAADKTYNLTAWYNSPYYTKLYFQYDIIRGGSVISTKSDSTTLIQFGTKNFTLNY